MSKIKTESGDDDPVIVCCILGLCCPAGSFEQADALTLEIKKRHPHMDDEKAKEKAGKVLEKHDYFRDILEIVDEDDSAVV